MRTFISIDLPDIVTYKLYKILPESDKWRKTDPEKLHITIRFIGEIGEKHAASILQNLAGIKFEPFMLKLNTLGCFPNKGRPKIFWAGFEHSVDIMDLSKRVDKVIDSVTGKEREKPFKPHVTLARVRKSLKYKVTCEQLTSQEFDSLEFNVTSFQLMKSVFEKGGVNHKRLAEYKAVKNG
jgi:2'-5' RNA ligase